MSRLAVRTDERVVFIAIEDIDWVEAAGNYVILHASNATHIMRETMGSLEEQLTSQVFLRVSRSAILNLHRVKESRSGGTTENVTILRDGQRVLITRSLREVEERLRSA